MKIAVVGGGSTYTPELVDGFARRAGLLHVDELILHDIDADRLDVVGGLSGRILAAQSYPGTVRTTASLPDALDGADAVLIQLRVGGQQTRLRDETIPGRYGLVGQETTGPGGFAKALRTVPVVLEIADATRKYARPDAWIVDFTNPVRIDGFDMLPEILASKYATELAADLGVPVDLMRMLDAIPSYYLHYFYCTDEAVEAERHGPHRAEEVLAIERELLRIYRDPALDRKPELLDQRGGAYYSEAAAALVTSLMTGDGARHYLNVRNDATIRGLPADAVVEVPATVDRSGAHPVAVPPLRPEMLGLVQAVTQYELLTIEAAKSGDPRVAARALLANPLVRQWQHVAALLDDILRENAQLLPRFAAARSTTGA